MLLLSTSGWASFALIGATVLPMDGGPPVSPATVVVEGDTIVAVGPTAFTAIPRDATIVRADGDWLLPGLTDTHVHVFDPADLPLYLAAGVTTVVNMAGTEAHLAWRDEIAAGRRAGPTLYSAGPLLDTLDDELFGVYARADTPALAAAATARTAADGFDFVKVHGELDRPSYDAVVATARFWHIPVVGHLSAGVGLAHAMDARQRSVEHAEEFVNTFFDLDLDPARIPDAVALTRAGGAWVTPTLVSIETLAATLTDAVDRYAADPWLSPVERALGSRSLNLYRERLGPAAAPWYRESLAFQEQLTAGLHRGGVPILAGTDAGWVPLLVPGRSLVRELELLVESGLPPTAALAAATVNAGRFVGGRFGTVAVGQRADLLLVGGDPRADLTTLDTPLAVMARGTWYPRAALDQLLARHAAAGRADAPLAEALLAHDATALVAAAAQPRVDSATVARVAMWLAQAGRGDDLVALLRVNATAHPDAWWALTLAGRAERLAGNPERATALLRRAATRAPPTVAGRLRAEATAG